MSEKVEFERLANPPKQGRSCWFHGCLAVVIIGLLGGAFVGLSGWWLYKQADSMVKEFTSDQPEKLPEIEYTREEIEALDKRIESFSQSLTNDAPAEVLEFTAEEVNKLIAARSGLSNGKNPFHVSIEGDKIRTRLSLPLDLIAEHIQIEAVKNRLKGRYINGEGSLKISLTDGKLEAYLDDFSVNGKDAPEEIMAEIRAQNMAEDAQLSPKERAALARFERIEIRDGKLIVAPKTTKE